MTVDGSSDTGEMHSGCGVMWKRRGSERVSSTATLCVILLPSQKKRGGVRGSWMHVCKMREVSECVPVLKSDSKRGDDWAGGLCSECRNDVVAQWCNVVVGSKEVGRCR